MEAVLVTGAGRRIGASLARALAADGWFVFLHHHRSRAEAEATLDEIRASGGAGQLIQADLADPQAVQRVVGACRASGPPLTALVNNASLFAYDDLPSMTVDSWDRHQAVNLRAPAILARDFAAALAADASGCIVNILDNKVFAVNPDFFSYTVSKLGLQGLTEVLAMALAPRVRVCGIAPGITLISGRQTQASFETSHRTNPLGRGATVDDIADALRFVLATPSLNAQVLTVDAGQSLMRLPRDVAFLDPQPVPVETGE